MQSRPGEGLGDFTFAERRAERFEACDDMAYELRELVDRFGELDQGVRPGFVDSCGPGRDSRGLNGERPGGLSERPGSSGLQFEDGNPFDRLIVRPAVRTDPGRPGVFEANLLAKQGDLLSEPINSSGQAGTSVDAVGRPAASGRQRVMSQRYGANYARPNGPRPADWQRDLVLRTLRR